MPHDEKIVRSLDEDLRESFVAHKAGRLSEAEAGYRRVLDARPRDAKALYYLGLLHFHRGNTQDAIDLVRRCVGLAPSNGPAWNTLGGLYIAAGLRAEAREAYRRVTVVAPSLGEGWYNLGICLRDEGDFDGAIEALRASVAHQPDYSRSYEALAMLLYQLERMPEAADVYREWSLREPENPKARHMVAATSQQHVPQRAADDYVRSLFDSSASSFDADLARLGYQAPQAVAAELERLSHGRVWQALLDAGCGTGLCGPLVRARCANLVGVDLSSNMIEQAKTRQCYDELIVSELTAFMRSRPGSFDALISADTLVYFGDLDEPLSAAREALRPQGALVFTLEALSEKETSPYRLEAHGRYAHNERYARLSLEAAGFAVEKISHAPLREERSQTVAGLLIAARRLSEI